MAGSTRERHPELCQSIVLTDMGEELCVALNGALDQNLNLSFNILFSDDLRIYSRNNI